MTRSRAANDVQTAVRMPSDLYNKLQAAAGDRSLGEEIRRRLETSFAGAIPAALDPSTAELVGAIMHIADGLQREYAPWHEDRFAHEVMKQTIAKLLRVYQPDGGDDFKVKFNPNGLAILIQYDDDTPEKVADSQLAVVLDRIREGRTKA
jgi:hypothetical protein